MTGAYIRLRQAMDHIVQVFVFGEGGLIWIYVTVHVSGVAICIFILLLTSAMKISGTPRVVVLELLQTHT